MRRKDAGCPLSGFLVNVTWVASSKGFSNQVILNVNDRNVLFTTLKKTKSMKIHIKTLHTFFAQVAVTSMAIILLAGNGNANPCENLFHAVVTGDIEAVQTAIEDDTNYKGSSCSNHVLVSLGYFIHEHAEICQLLIENGADVNFKNEWNQTALIIAAQSGYSRIVTLLLEHGADPHIHDQFGDTAMEKALANTHRDIIRLLLAHDTQICPHDDPMTRDVIQAVVEGHIERVNGALARGMDVNANCDGHPLLKYAVIGGSPDVVALLLEHGADIQKGEEHMLLSVTNAEVANVLIDAGADIHARSETGMTGLMSAALGGYADVVELFLQHGADLNAVDTSHQHTALMTAAMKGHVDVVEGLLKYDVDMNAQDRMGGTALIYAALNGHAEVVKRLLEHGADVTIQGNDGRTALQCAEDNEHKIIIRLLKEASRQ
jgi:ankyrin repeat protein